MVLLRRDSQPKPTSYETTEHLYCQLSCKRPPSVVHDKVVAYEKNQQNKPKTELINNTRSPLMKTLDRSVETLGRELQLFKLHSSIFKPE